MSILEQTTRLMAIPIALVAFLACTSHIGGLKWRTSSKSILALSMPVDQPHKSEH